MQLKQANLVLAVSMAVVGVIVIASGVLVFNSFQDASATKSERDSKFDRFRGICRKDPFPNEKNIAQMGENVHTVSNWYGTLLEGLGDPLVFTKHEAASIFGSRREQVIAGLREVAPAGLGGARVVSPEFMFGFEAYREGKTAKISEVPRLLYQLDLIDSIVRAMYDSKVLAINAIEREVFEQGAGAEAVAEEEESSGGRRRNRNRNRGRSSSSDSEEASSTGVSVDAQGNFPEDFALPLNRQIFKFDFLAKEESLIQLLNRLSSMERYIAVTALQFEKKDSDFFKEKEEKSETRSGGGLRRGLGTRKEAEPTAAATPAEPASRLARSFTGKNLESPIAVKMTLEVYAIADRSSESEAQEGEE